MPSTLQLEPSKDIQAVLMGASGAGKSTLAATFPRPNFMSFDCKMDAVKHPEFVKKYGHRDIQYEFFRERSFDERSVIKAHNAFDDACKYFDKWMKPDLRDKFDTWVIDSGTTLSDAAMNKAIVLLGSTDFRKMSNTFEQASKSGLVFPKKQDYGAERSMVEQFIRMVKDSGKMVLVLVHEMEITNDAGSITAVKPLLTGGSREVVPAMFDNLWYIRKRPAGPKVERVLITDSDPILGTKCPWGIGTIIDPDYDKIKLAVTQIQSTIPVPGAPQAALVSAN